MAKLPVSVDKIIEKHGPHKAYAPQTGFQGNKEPDKLVKTHCCYCGMQCGIKLKVKDNKIAGFEPWEEFPFPSTLSTGSISLSGWLFCI